MNKTPSTQQATHADQQPHFADLSAEAQRLRLLDVLRCESVSTLEARRNLDILHPAMRVRELRQDGYVIHTLRVPADTGFGIKHSVARYVLVSEPGRDGDASA